MYLIDIITNYCICTALDKYLNIFNELGELAT
jgi:hypothetical protein